MGGGLGCHARSNSLCPLHSLAKAVEERVNRDLRQTAERVSHSTHPHGARPPAFGETRTAPVALSRGAVRSNFPGDLLLPAIASAATATTTAAAAATAITASAATASSAAFGFRPRFVDVDGAAADLRSV